MRAEGKGWLDGPECTEVPEGLNAPEARVRVGQEVPEVLEIECPLTACMMIDKIVTMWY